MGWFLIVIFVIIGVLIFMSTNEITESSESKIVVSLLLVWAFSFVGWLDTGFALTGTGNTTILSQYGNKFGIAILSSAFASYFIGRRLVV